MNGFIVKVMNSIEKISNVAIYYVPIYMLIK